MFVSVSGATASRPRFLGELGSLAQNEIILSEFKYRRGAEIFGEAEPAEYLYQVIDGAVRSYKLLSDGRRQTGPFPPAADVFGPENGEPHRSTAEAIVETTVGLAGRASLANVAEQ